MTASWLDEPWLSIDTETTGVDWTTDRVVEVAAVSVLPDGSIGDQFCTLVDAGVEIPEEAVAVHGITTARTRDEGMDPAKAIAAVADRIFEHGHRPIVMFHARFDWPILLAEAERHCVDFPFLAPVLDPFLVDKMIDKYRKGSRKLLAVAQHYAVELEEAEAHGALADAVASARVMRAIVRRYPQIGQHSLASVFLRQVRGHEQWRVGFVEYKRRTDPRFDIDPGWPVPSGGLPVVEKDATQQGAGDDGPNSGGDASDTPGGRTPDTAAGDGADSHDVGRTEPEPAPTHLSEPSPPAPGVTGEGVDGQVNAPTRLPAPGPDTRGVTVVDVAKAAQAAFHAAYDEAPRGQKTKVLTRLRHAFTYACTGRVFSLDDCTPAELAAVWQRLHLLTTGEMGYQLVDDGVAFIVAGSDARAVVRWEQLTSMGAAA